MRKITIKEAADQAGINENTARYYRNKYGEFFPATGVGRHRRYAPETIQILRIIKDCYDDGMDAEGVRDKLNETFGVPVVTTTTALQQPKRELIGLIGENLVPVIEDIIDRALKNALDRQAVEYKEEINKLRSEIEGIHERINSFNRDTELRDQEVMRRIREIQTRQQIQADSQAAKSPWWKFW